MVLSDIEMPRMDGFDLARNIRADAALARPADHHDHLAHRREAPRARAELGVDHYLGKPYSEDELLSLVRALRRADRDRLSTAAQTRQGPLSRPLPLLGALPFFAAMRRDWRRGGG